MGQLVLLIRSAIRAEMLRKGDSLSSGDVCVEDLQAHGVPGQWGGHHRDACPRALHLGGPGAGTAGQP